jgi:hypothetical protein
MSYCKKQVLEAVLRIREMLVGIRIRGSVPLTMDPDPVQAVDPAIFVIQELSFSVYCFLLVCLHTFSKIKSLRSHKTVLINIFLTVFA